MENIPVQEHLIEYLHKTYKDNTTFSYRMNECDLFQVCHTMLDQAQFIQRR